MALLDWLRAKLSPKRRAIWLYRRGVLRARAGQSSAAVEDYGEVIDTPEIDPNVRAMALYNRALLLWSSGNETAAHEDLHRVLEDSGASEQVKIEARRKLLRIDRSAQREEKADRQQ